MHLSTVHGKSGQQLRLEEKKKKKKNAEILNVDAQTRNPNTVLVSFVCGWDQRHSITQMEHIIVLKEGLVIFFTFLWAKEKSWNNRFL